MYNLLRRPYCQVSSDKGCLHWSRQHVKIIVEMLLSIAVAILASKRIR